MWNPARQPTPGAKVLEDLLIRFDLVVINEEGIATRKVLENLSIINLTITSPSIGDLMSWLILRGGCSSTSNHELILVGWEDQENDLILLDGGQLTDWDIKNMLEDGELLEKATIK